MELLLATALLLPAKTGFAFGRAGGNIMPFTIAISSTGVVRATGAAPPHVHAIGKQRLADLTRLAATVRFSKLPASTMCPGTLPDVAAEVVRVGGRAVRVHGSCVTRFNRMWHALDRAVAAPS